VEYIPEWEISERRKIGCTISGQDGPPATEPATEYIPISAKRLLELSIGMPQLERVSEVTVCHPATF